LLTSLFFFVCCDDKFFLEQLFFLNFCAATQLAQKLHQELVTLLFFKGSGCDISTVMVDLNDIDVRGKLNRLPRFEDPT